MKYRKYIILALVLVSGLFSCQRDEDIAIAILNINSEVIEPSYTSADVECYVECNTKFDNVVVEYASSEDFADAQSATMSEKEGKYHAKCVNLLDDTTYYIRYVVSNRLSSMTYKEISSFRTLTPSIPVVHLDSISNIWDVKADAFAHVEFDGGSPLSEWGITIWTDETTDTLRIKTESQEQCLIPIQDLQPNTIYNARAYAINKVGVAYSKEMSFITLTLPKIQTGAITDIQLTTALLNGTLVFNGNDTTTIKGFCWGQEQEPTIDDPHIQIDTASNTFFYHLSNLKDETQYQVRAYAKNKIGITYGNVFSFTTKAAIPPTVTSSSVTNITYTSATVGGNVTSDGGATVTECGVVYSTSQNPTTSNTKITSGTGTGSFTCDITNLQEGTTYYVRAYAINKKGTSYGEQKSFTTKAYALPTVTTSSATNISYTSATVGGNVTSDGGTSVTERGVVYSTNQNPTTASSKVTGGSGTGSFTCNITNLQENTKYYVRAYATNRKGTSYAPQASFTTQAYALPTVTTSSATNISYTSATVGGNVTSDGGASVTERGVVYGTSQNPTTSNRKVQSGSGTGAFTCSLTNLQEGTTYYVRAYAVNQKGIIYGGEMSFITKDDRSFSVSSSKRILFSSGNLQYYPANNEWRFAESQLDCIAAANSNISSSYNGWIDLFGWSTGTTNFGLSTSISYSDYSGSFVDWGTNKIGNDAPNTWRTLTSNEWYYVVVDRPNASSLCGVAQVNGVNGLILLPDNWLCPTGVTFKSGFHITYGVDYYAAYQTFTADQWSKLESAGAVFLPAAGRRNGSNVNFVQEKGYYWSAIGNNSDLAYYLNFRSGEAYMVKYYRYYGLSVRLVKDL